MYCLSLLYGCLCRARAEMQLSAPEKKVSMRKSRRKKLEAAGAGATATAAEPAAIQQQQRCSTGPTFVSLGMSPFYQMNNNPRPGWKWCKMTYYLLLLSYEDGAEFYPFKTLAAAKAKYGAGLHNYKYDDPNVEWRNCFLCHNRKGIHSSCEYAMRGGGPTLARAPCKLPVRNMLMSMLLPPRQGLVVRCLS